MRVKYSVSFEFDLRPVLTHVGEVEGWTAGTCTRRAVEEAQRALAPVNWRSMVCVLLERLDTTAETVSESDTVGEPA